MAIINGVDMPNFSESEFSEDTKHADPILLTNTQKYRNIIGVPFNLSPVPGALARFDDESKTSEHYAVDQQSKALVAF